jgi:protein tyrosine/serine phosphatase
MRYHYGMKSDTLKAILLLGALLTIAPIAVRAAVPAGVPNFGVVDPGIYRGAAPTAKGLAALKEMGVVCVVDLRISPKQVKAEGAEVRRLGMRFVNLPMGSDPPTAKEETQFLAIVAQAGRQPVFVHCQYGADRTGVMIGLYRRIDDHWPYDKTYAEMRRYGFKKHLTKLAAFVKNAAAN